MRTITGSGLSRVMQCPASASIPAIFEESGDAAALGDVLHLFFQRVVQIGRKAALSAMPDDIRDVCAAIDTSWIETMAGDRYAELAYRYNAITDEAFALNTSGRNYPTGEHGDVFCTVDLVNIKGVEYGADIDYKTGRNPVAPCKDNWQLRLSALASARAHDLSIVDMRVAYLRDDGSWEFDDYQADAMDLDSWADEIKRGYQMAHAVSKAVEVGGIPDVFPSDDACRWCPCRQSCPAKTTALVQFRKAFELATPDIVRSVIARLDATEAGEVAARVLQIATLVEAAREAITERAAEEALPLPNGKFLRSVEQTRDFINGSVAHRVLSEKFGNDIADKVCTRSTSKSAMRVLGKELDGAVEAIRDAGGIDSKTYKLLKEVKR